MDAKSLFFVAYAIFFIIVCVAMLIVAIKENAKDVEVYHTKRKAMLNEVKKHEGK